VGKNRQHCAFDIDEVVSVVDLSEIDGFRVCNPSRNRQADDLMDRPMPVIDVLELSIVDRS
jgi:hypothetical protein